MLRFRYRRMTTGLTSILFITIPGTLANAAQQKNAPFSQLAEQARKASDESRLEEAAALYTRALALHPRWTDGWWSLGTIEYDQSLYAKAATAFTRLVALQPGNGTAHAMLGLCQFELQQDDSALKNLLKAEKLNIIKNEELRTVALYHLGVLLLRARKFGDAKETLDQLAKVRIKTKASTTALGFAVLLMSPKDIPPEGTPGAYVIERAGEAETLLMQKDFEQAKQIYTQLTADYPEYPNLHFAFGRLLLETNETDLAIQQFQLELKRDPQNVNSLLEIAAVRYQVDSQDGLSYAEKALQLAPRLPLTHYLVGLLRLDTGNAAGAIAELEIAQKAFPNESRIYFSLGTAYSRTSRKAEATKARAEFVRLSAQEKQRAATLYGDRPLGLAGGQLETLGKGNPQP
ncbi:MAG TPA: tetratricopeptide repeat protein [Candidatus Acidoferrum sp.]|nr:tetratricopeptide repeat protein [Candidatus Acidoferrum sp.]